jgi:hypothetical protein
MLMGVRMYETEQQARDAAAKLVAAGLREENMYVLTPVQGGEELAIKVAVEERKLPGNYMNVAVNALRNGRTILSVPLVYEGRLVMEIMDSFNPVDTHLLPKPPDRDPTPLSDLLGIPVLWKTRPGATLLRSQRYIFPNFFGLPGARTLLSDKRPSDSSLGMPVLLEERDTPKTHSFLLPLLTKDGKTTSSKLGFKELTEPKKRKMRRP